ncbi:hypothetical protein DFP72DRAFT_1099689 [Ephemerocybe angulata]|uniref:Uncharacterized protein n=1 Tax=Ephemerocybe angulata TaxID=980116 RepID=A0A8H6HBS9_9AGAR|nr:hypothetical protein DFP72DRAFT_1099689 [Tulosesus angulatus]
MNTLNTTQIEVQTDDSEHWLSGFGPSDSRALLGPLDEVELGSSDLHNLALSTSQLVKLWQHLKIQPDLDSELSALLPKLSTLLLPSGPQRPEETDSSWGHLNNAPRRPLLRGRRVPSQSSAKLLEKTSRLAKKKQAVAVEDDSDLGGPDEAIQAEDTNEDEHSDKAKYPNLEGDMARTGGALDECDSLRTDEEDGLGEYDEADEEESSDEYDQIDAEEEEEASEAPNRSQKRRLVSKGNSKSVKIRRVDARGSQARLRSLPQFGWEESFSIDANGLSDQEVGGALDSPTVTRTRQPNASPISPAPHLTNLYYVTNHGNPIAEEQPLEPKLRRFLGMLAAVSQDVLCSELRPSSITSNVHEVLQSLRKRSEPSADVSETGLSLSGMTAILSRIQEAEIIEGVASLLYFLNVIQFAFAINRELVERAFGGITEQTIFYEIEQQQKKANVFVNNRKQLRRYLEDGTKACALGGAGSLYLVVLLACTRARMYIQNVGGDSVLRLARMISRPPTGTVTGNLITMHIIPAVAYLRTRYPIKLVDLFPLDFVVNVGSWVTCGDLPSTDILFNKILTQQVDFAKLRDNVAWQAALLPVEPGEAWQTLQDNTIAHALWERLTGNKFDSPSSTIKTISTGFNPNLKRNSKAEYVQEDYDMTVKERTLALAASKANDIDEFETLIKTNLSNGHRKAKSPYVELNTSHLQGGTLRIDDKHGDWILVAFTDMPDHIRASILEITESLFPDLITDIDTEAEGEDYDYDAIHISVYNRYAMHAKKGAPLKADIATIYKRGKKHVNSCTTVPRSSQEGKDSPMERDVILDAFSSMLDWISEKVQKTLPEDCAITAAFVDILPGKHSVPCYPFPGLVINFNVATRIHKDIGDDNFCISVAFANCDGGDLCLWSYICSTLANAETEFALGLPTAAGVDLMTIVTSSTIDLANGWQKAVVQFEITTPAAGGQVLTQGQLGLIIAVVLKNRSPAVELPFLVGQLAHWIYFEPGSATTPLNGTLNFEVAVAFDPVPEITITDPEDPHVPWHLQPTKPWFPKLLYFNVSAQQLSGGAGSTPGPLTWIGTTTYINVGDKKTFYVLLQDNLPYSSGQRMYDFNVQPALETGEVVEELEEEEPQAESSSAETESVQEPLAQADMEKKPKRKSSVTSMLNPLNRLKVKGVKADKGDGASTK